jgi:hypothetical protein
LNACFEYHSHIKFGCGSCEKGSQISEFQQKPISVHNKQQAKKKKGHIPMNVPMKKGIIGTLMTGEVMLMNQFGRKGVIRRKMM